MKTIKTIVKEYFEGVFGILGALLILIPVVDLIYGMTQGHVTVSVVATFTLWLYAIWLCGYFAGRQK